MLAFGGKTDAGRVREHNEDYFASDPESKLWVVADGIGGYQSGDIASEVVTQSILEQVRSGISLTDAIVASHDAIQKAAEMGRGSTEMGATVVAVQMDGADCELGWVGDSRAYLWNGELRQLSKDHSYVESLVDNGDISREEAHSHPSKNVLTRYLGVKKQENLAADQLLFTFHRGEELLLCTDGLTDELTDSDIAQILAKPDPLQNRVEQLVDAALENGGNDNITVVLIEASSDAPKRAGGQSLRNENLLFFGIGAVISTVLIVVAIYYLSLSS